MENKRKKILRLTTADISLEGLLEGQLKYLNNYYNIVGVASDTGLLDYVSKREGIRVINAPMHREISIVNDVKSLLNLYRMFKREKPWMVHANTPKGSLLAMVAAWAARVPKRLYTVTGLRYQGAQGVLRFILKTMERITCLCATNVIPEGQGVLHALKTDKITFKPLHVLHFGNINGKDTRHLSRRQTVADYIHAPYDKISDEDVQDLRRSWRLKHGFDNDDFVFIFIGRIVNDKGMTELAHAMQQLTAGAVSSVQDASSCEHDDSSDKQDTTIDRRDAGMPRPRLLLVGNMEKGDAISDEVHQYFTHDKNITYVGPKQDVRPWLLISDALVFPSYREGFPNVPMEAGSMGLASIVTNINGANEIIKDGLNGKIIEAPLDSKGRHVHDITPALRETMLWFMGHRAEVERMSANAPRMIHERYEQKDVWKALLEYYRSLE